MKNGEQTRRCFTERILGFENDEQQEWFSKRSFQGCEACEGGVIASVGGRIFKIDTGNYWVKQIFCE